MRLRISPFPWGDYVMVRVTVARPIEGGHHRATENWAIWRDLTKRSHLDKNDDLNMGGGILGALATREITQPADICFLSGNEIFTLDGEIETECLSALLRQAAKNIEPINNIRAAIEYENH